MSNEVENLMATWPSEAQDTARRVLSLVSRIAPVTEYEVACAEVRFVQGGVWGKMQADENGGLVVTFYGGDRIQDPWGTLSEHGDARSATFHSPSEVPKGRMVGFVQNAVATALQRESMRRVATGRA